MHSRTKNRVLQRHIHICEQIVPAARERHVGLQLDSKQQFLLLTWTYAYHRTLVDPRGDGHLYTAVPASTRDGDIPFRAGKRLFQRHTHRSIGMETDNRMFTWLRFHLTLSKS